MADILDDDFSNEEIDFSKVVFAPFFDRIAAFGIDVMLAFLLPYILLGVWLNILGSSLYTIPALILWCYKVLMEGMYGETVGKQKMNYKLLNYRLSGIHWQQAITRNIWYGLFFLITLADALIYERATTALVTNYFLENFLSLLRYAFFISVIVIPFTPRKQALHDLWAKTVCIKYFKAGGSISG